MIALRPTPLLVALGLLAAVALAPRPVGAAEPRLVLLLAVDQLRPDRLDPALPGGLGRLAREGRVYTDAALDHAITETCPGHVSIASGRHPGPAGVPGNRFFDRAQNQVRYCVEDSAEEARVLGGSEGRSPRLIRADALGDWLKAAEPKTRVFAVSGKDRAAIALGGKHPDGVYWLLRRGRVGFTTSRYYREALPEWVERWNGEHPARDGFLSRYPDRWVHEVEAGSNPARVDDYPAEDPERSRVSGHPVRDDDVETFAGNFYATPFLDDATLDFAEHLVRAEAVGSDETTDLLSIGLSATDIIGHAYGPESHEARDALLRLDAALGDFLEALEERVGEGRLLVVVTADHGVLPIPEWLTETGRSECPVAGGRAGVTGMLVRLSLELHLSVGPFFSVPFGWLHLTGANIGVDRERAKRFEIEIERVVAVTEEFLEKQEAVREVWTEQEILNGDSETARLYRNSFDPERSGDLAVEVAPTCLISPMDYGTTHGSPHAYDRAVPLVFWGPSIAPERVDGRAATIDIAPTIARLLHVEPPPGLDGRPLFGPAFD